MKIFCMIKIDCYGDDAWKYDYAGMEAFSTMEEAVAAGEKHAEGYAQEYKIEVIDTETMLVRRKV